MSTDDGIIGYWELMFPEAREPGPTRYDVQVVVTILLKLCVAAFDPDLRPAFRPEQRKALEAAFVPLLKFIESDQRALLVALRISMVRVLSEIYEDMGPKRSSCPPAMAATQIRAMFEEHRIPIEDAWFSNTVPVFNERDTTGEVVATLRLVPGTYEEISAVGGPVEAAKKAIGAILSPGYRQLGTLLAKAAPSTSDGTPSAFGVEIPQARILEFVLADVIGDSLSSAEAVVGFREGLNSHQ